MVIALVSQENEVLRNGFLLRLLAAERSPGGLYCWLPLRVTVLMLFRPAFDYSKHGVVGCSGRRYRQLSHEFGPAVKGLPVRAIESEAARGVHLRDRHLPRGLAVEGVKWKVMPAEE